MNKKKSRFMRYYEDELRTVAGVIVINITMWSLMFFAVMMNPEMSFRFANMKDMILSFIPLCIVIIGFSVALALFSEEDGLIEAGLLISIALIFIAIILGWDMGNLWCALPLKFTILSTIGVIGYFSLIRISCYLDRRRE